MAAQVLPTPRRPGHHQCPGPQCPQLVPDSMLACKPHWSQLSTPVKDAIYATRYRNLLHPDRCAAITAALEEWYA